MELLKKDRRNMGRNRTADVMISPAQKQAYFTLTESARGKLYSERLAFGVEGNRLYFVETDDPDVGYKIAKSPRSNLYVVAAGKSVLKWLKGRKGYFNLIYDTDKKSYYIEMRKEV